VKKNPHSKYGYDGSTNLFGQYILCRFYWHFHFHQAFTSISTSISVKLLGLPNLLLLNPSVTSITIIASLIAFAGIVSATPTNIPARDVPVLDVFVSEATQDSHAIQIEIGNLKVCIGDNGFAPCLATELSISPFGANIDTTYVTCEAFTDTAGTQPIGSFTSANVLYFAGVTAVGSVSCDF
jgi:hypothetical protein